MVTKSEKVYGEDEPKTGEPKLLIQAGMADIWLYSDIQAIELLYNPQAKYKESGYQIPINKRRPYQMDLFEGFTYFSPEGLSERLNIMDPKSTIINKPLNFLFAQTPEKKAPQDIIGVLKLGTYNDYGYLPDFWSIDFVDIREDKRNRGIATSLFRSLNEILTPNDLLVGTILSPLGKAYKLGAKLHRIITACPYFDDVNRFYQYCVENGLHKPGRSDE
jgi:hypothetical protein